MANWATQTATRECQIASNGELTVVERLATLLETGQFADVTITVGEGDDVVTFKAHRLLLATASQSLNNLVASNIKNGPGEVASLRVTDVDPDAFQHILKYIYTDDLEIGSTGESLTLLRVGKKWGLQNLVDKTIKFLDAFLNEYEPISEERKNELCDLTVLTEEYELDLTTKCWNVLLKNVNEVVPCQGFLNMSKDMVRRLLKHPDFHFKDHLVLFEAIRDWGMNQVLQQHLSVNSLQGLIGDLLQHIDFRTIKDGDFLDTVLPSECLGKADVIAFFLARGLEIPRDLIYNNNNKEDSGLPYEKSGRYKRGYKLPNQEIYKEHELRFRVDKKLRLLGVGFGFLFSNTDMGITIHCKGPWETRQWGDIMQTYCRVSWEKMKTADVRLMFIEPVIIEPNHCYKVLVRVSRMSTGTSDVDLWGGSQGVSRLKIKGGEISFLKAAVDSKKEVEDSDTENNPGMITDLIYELVDGSTPTSPTTQSSSSILKKEKTTHFLPSPQSKKKKPEESSISRSNYMNIVGEPCDESSLSRNKSRVNTVADPDSEIDSTSNSSYSFRRNVPSPRIEDDLPSPTETATKQKKSQADEAASYYLATRPSSIRGSDAIPAFLRSRQPSVEKMKPSWQIPSRSRTSTAVFSPYKPREPSANRDHSAAQDTNYTSRRPPRQSSNIFDKTPLSKYSYGISNIKSKYEFSSPSSTLSGKTYEPSSSTYQSSSRYGSTSGPPSKSNTSSSTSKTESRSKPLRYSSSTSDTRYGTSSSGTSSVNKTDSLSALRYGSGASGSRSGRESASPSRFTTSSPSLYRYGKSTSSQNTGRETGLSKTSSGTLNTLGTSRYSTSGTSSSLGSSNRYGLSTLGTAGVSNTPGSSTRYGPSSSGTTSTSSSIGTTNRYESSISGSTGTSSTVGSSRFGSTSSNTTGTTGITGTGSSSLGTRYGSSSSTPSYLTTSRFGTNSPFGSSYSSLSNRFGSSIYRR